jgi:hypothetical protein
VLILAKVVREGEYEMDDDRVIRLGVDVDVDVLVLGAIMDESTEASKAEEREEEEGVVAKDSRFKCLLLLLFDRNGVLFDDIDAA